MFFITSSHPRGWETNVVLLGVQLAQTLTVLLATACALLGLLALVAHFRHPAPSQVLQPVYARRIVRRATRGRPSSADLAPFLPSRDPPPVPPFRTQEPYPDRETR